MSRGCSNQRKQAFQSTLPARNTQNSGESVSGHIYGISDRPFSDPDSCQSLPGNQPREYGFKNRRCADCRRAFYLSISLCNLGWITFQPTHQLGIASIVFCQFCAWREAIQITVPTTDSLPQAFEYCCSINHTFYGHCLFTAPRKLVCGRGSSFGCSLFYVYRYLCSTGRCILVFSKPIRNTDHGNAVPDLSCSSES